MRYLSEFGRLASIIDHIEGLIGERRWGAGRLARAMENGWSEEATAPLRALAQ